MLLMMETARRLVIPQPITESIGEASAKCLPMANDRHYSVVPATGAVAYCQQIELKLKGAQMM